MNKKIIIFITSLIIIAIISISIADYSINSQSAHIKKIKEYVSEIYDYQLKIESENKKEKKDGIAIDASKRKMANDFESISKEYEQLKSDENKQEIITYIKNSRITKEVYEIFEEYLNKDRVNKDLLNIYE
jgi:hypothetical protein